VNQQEKLPLSWNLAGVAILFGLGFIIHACSDPADPNAGMPTETLNPGYVGCVTEQDLRAFNAAPHRMQVSMMMNHRCIPTSDLPAHSYVILEGVLVAHVRLLLADDQYADLYVPREATMRDRAPEVADVSK
jgi:hypothetical protein